jgi:thiamine biosynthesis lipoprotein
VTLSNLGIATSGTAEQGLHIWNPKTGAPANEIVSISVVAKDVCLADGLATAAFAAGEKGIDLLAGMGLPAYMVTKEKQAVLTPAWSDLVMADGNKKGRRREAKGQIYAEMA